MAQTRSMLSQAIDFHVKGQRGRETEREYPTRVTVPALLEYYLTTLFLNSTTFKWVGCICSNRQFTGKIYDGKNIDHWMLSKYNAGTSMWLTRRRSIGDYGERRIRNGNWRNIFVVESLRRGRGGSSLALSLACRPSLKLLLTHHPW